MSVMKKKLIKEYTGRNIILTYGTVGTYGQMN